MLIALLQCTAITSRVWGDLRQPQYLRNYNSRIIPCNDDVESSSQKKLKTAHLRPSVKVPENCAFTECPYIYPQVSFLFVLCLIKTWPVTSYVIAFMQLFMFCNQIQVWTLPFPEKPSIILRLSLESRSLLEVEVSSGGVFLEGVNPWRDPQQTVTKPWAPGRL